MNWGYYLWETITIIILIYSIVTLSFYVFIGLFSIRDTRRYVLKNALTDYRLLASSSHFPSVSIIAPAYNEGATIVENVKSLLSLYYSNLEVVIVNDGSKDDSLAKVIEAYDLEKVDFFVRQKIPAKEVRGVYKSRNPVYKNLLVVDKVNGGKADALNVGINISSHDYIICIDVDCIIEQDAILKMMKPFLEETDHKVIASGGVVRIANSCVIEDGRLVEVRLPGNYLARMQTLEYIRAFLLGRMAWSRLNGLLLISGAFGAFDKAIAIKAGGYNVKTVGEDMELVVRMRRLMEEEGTPYRVTYIPDPLCWTEAPTNTKILGKQRNRWTRGTIETLKMHKIMFLNFRYGVLGLISYPYWFFFEMLAPGIEFIGFVIFLILTAFGLVDWTIFLALLAFILSFGYMYSMFAILIEAATYNQYKKLKETGRLILSALSEPFYFHPFVVFSGLKGYIDFVRKKHAWGDMTRQGFAAKTAEVPESSGPLSFKERLLTACRDYASISLVFIGILMFSSLLELVLHSVAHQIPENPGLSVFYSLANDTIFWLKYQVLLLPLYVVLHLLKPVIARSILVPVFVLLSVSNLLLIAYFSSVLTPLGADLYGYSENDLRQTVGAAGVLSTSYILPAVAIILLLAFILTILPKKIRTGSAVYLSLPVLSLICLIWLKDSFIPGSLKSEYSRYLVLNKSDLFFRESYMHFYPQDNKINAYGDAEIAANEEDNKDLVRFNYTDKNYPFLHDYNSLNTLSPFFEKKDSVPPDIVILLVEGLGRAFSNQDSYLGSFTPFLDSLSHNSLYFSNMLSSGGRTFAVLPSILGSLPFSNNGFLELGEKMPHHLSLPGILKKSGYNTAFYCGTNASFDQMDIFMKKNYALIQDLPTFPPGYTKLPVQNGFTWGYNDKEVYRRYFDTQKVQGPPKLNIILTLSSHNPFLINEQEKYFRLLDQRMNELKFDQDKKKQYMAYKYQYTSILYTDDALRQFFNRYSKREDFKKTIFIITGDHRMPEIPMTTKIDRFHVPLIIYSPLLKRSAKIDAISTHFDIMPSLLALLHEQYNIALPKYDTWIGAGLDTVRSFRNIHSAPLMQAKSIQIDFVMGEYHLNGSQLFRLSGTMDEEPIQDDHIFKGINALFSDFKSRNATVSKNPSLVPDSIYQRFNFSR